MIPEEVNSRVMASAVLAGLLRRPAKTRIATTGLMMKKSIFAIFLLLYTGQALPAETFRNISAEGSCAIVGMSAEQSQLIALQRARVAAIEQAAGVSVTSATLVTNMQLAADIIKTYAKGFIVNERVEWLPLGQYQKDSSTPPIPEYRVKIIADVRVPETKIKPMGLEAKTKGALFKNGERASIELRTERGGKAAIFNITADDKVVMLFPNDVENNNLLIKGKVFTFPENNSKVELILQTLPGHKRDAEAFFVVAMDSSHPREFQGLFTPAQPMSFSAFFQKYAEIADFCEDVILPYEILEAEER